MGSVIMTDGVPPDSRSPGARKHDMALDGANSPVQPLTPTFAIGILTWCRSSILRDFRYLVGEIAIIWGTDS
jgi:hypothetical protein